MDLKQQVYSVLKKKIEILGPDFNLTRMFDASLCLVSFHSPQKIPPKSSH